MVKLRKSRGRKTKVVRKVRQSGKLSKSGKVRKNNKTRKVKIKNKRKRMKKLRKGVKVGGDSSDSDEAAIRSQSFQDSLNAFHYDKMAKAGKDIDALATAIEEAENDNVEGLLQYKNKLDDLRKNLN